MVVPRPGLDRVVGPVGHGHELAVEVAAEALHGCGAVDRDGLTSVTDWLDVGLTVFGTVDIILVVLRTVALAALAGSETLDEVATEANTFAANGATIVISG